MRIEFTEIEYFCQELQECAPRIKGPVRVRIDSTPEQAENISQAIGMWATALVAMDDGEYVMEFGMASGSDGPGSATKGTDLAKQWRSQVADVCERCDLPLRNGKIEVY
jgi:hypothetical protein